MDGPQQYQIDEDRRLAESLNRQHDGQQNSNMPDMVEFQDNQNLDDEQAALLAIQRQRDLAERHGVGNPLSDSFQAQSFGDARQADIDLITREVLLQFVTNVLLLGLFQWILEDYKKQGRSCGIPVIWWIQILFYISYGKSILDLNLLWIVRTRHSWVLRCRLVNFFVQQFLSGIWTVYGIQLYFSEQNNCQEYPDTQTALIWMCIFLFFGFIGMIFFAMAMVGLPLLYIYLRDYNQRPDLQQDEIPGIIRSLQQSSYNPSNQGDSTCHICMEDYKSDDMVTTLKCSTKHMFHSDCIIKWIQQGHNTCPICRAPIENLENLREQSDQQNNGNQ